jgi:ABC-type molybdate transport system substrate-binding protein
MTDARTVDRKCIKQIIEIAEEKHGPIIYGLGKISSGKNSFLADRFIEFIRQPECKKIFVEAGFTISERIGE